MLYYTIKEPDMNHQETEYKYMPISGGFLQMNNSGEIERVISTDPSLYLKHSPKEKY